MVVAGVREQDVRVSVEAEAATCGGRSRCAASRTSSPWPSARPIARCFPWACRASGFLRFPAQTLGAEPACGVVYRTEDLVTNGMPLGGIDTGCLDLETSGMLGYSTIFNTLVSRGGQWVDATEPITPVPMELSRHGLEQQGVRTVKEIHYWGHYPVADLEFETDAPAGVGLRAWSPFLPGQIVESMLPGAVFEVHLVAAWYAPEWNAGGYHWAGTIALSFPEPLEKEAGASEYARSVVDGAFRGWKSPRRWLPVRSA